MMISSNANDAEKTEADAADMSMDNQAPTSERGSSRTTRTSKSGITSAYSKGSKSSSVIVQIDPSVLHQISTEIDRTDSDDRDPSDWYLFCGFACDIVRACILFNVAYLVKNIIIMALSVINVSLNQGIESEYDDDGVLTESEKAVQKATMVIIVNGIGVLVAMVGIIGASKFYKSLVFCTAIWYTFDAIFRIVFFVISDNKWGGLAFALICLYPHCALFVALYKGKITRENYATIQKCFLCNTEHRDSDSN